MVHVSPADALDIVADEVIKEAVANFDRIDGEAIQKGENVQHHFRHLGQTDKLDT